MKNKINSLFDYRNCATLTFINFWFAIFVDSIFAYKNFKITHPETIVYLIVTNVSFVVFLIATIKKSKATNKTKKSLSIKNIFNRYYPLIVLLGIIIVLAVINYRNVAVYDAHLYYGAYVKAFELFEQNIRTAIGSFILWGHVFVGTALFLAPIETLMMGEMYGVYIGNTILFCVTLVILYKLLEEYFAKPNKFFIAFIVGAFAFMPYSFNLVTYFSPDFYLELYLIWLMYAYKKDNQLMVSFIGFLLCFTKDTGAFVYGFFMLSTYAFECFSRHKHTGFKWWKFKNMPFGKFVLWLIPAGLYGICFFEKPKYQLQVFSGGGMLTFGINPYDIKLQVMQSFVFGFRWLIIAIAVVALIVYIIKKSTKKYERVTNIEYAPLLYSNIATSLLLTLMLSVFTLSHCPRYTNPLNVAYAMILGVSLSVIFYNLDVLKNTVALFMSIIMLGQVYYTIDPAIRKNCTYINTGCHKVFNIGNLNGNVEKFSYDLLGDYYVYNNEYSLYSDLMRKVVKHINPKKDIKISVFDLYYYEMHIAGVQYPINWDVKHKRQTYAENENTINVSAYSVDLQAGVDSTPKKVYLVVPARRDATEALKTYASIGYELVDTYVASNQYGNVILYTFNKL